MTKVTIHIGRHKTGTSSVQATLAKNYDVLRSRGILYPRCLPENNSRFFINAFSPSPETFPGNKQFGNTRQKLRRDAEEDFKNLSQELIDFDGSHIIFSGENACTLPLQGIKNVKNGLDKLIDPESYEIIYYTRNPFSLASSAIQQNVKGDGMTLEDAKLRQLRGGGNRNYQIIRDYQEVFGKETVIVRSFEDSLAEFGDVFADFASKTGIDLKGITAIRKNESISAEVVHFLSWLYKGPRISKKEMLYGRATRVPVTERDKNLLFQLKGTKADFLSEDEIEKIWSVVSDDMSFLKDNHGISYGKPKATNIGNLEIFQQEFMKRLDEKKPSLSKPLKAELDKFINTLHPKKPSVSSTLSDRRKNVTVGSVERYPDETGKRQAEGGLRMQGKVCASRPDAPLVTIITVCWNSAKTIEKTFQSVRDQTYKNIEYVVVDGGSTDGTVDLLKAHEDLIDYYVSEPDKGLYYAMNKGLELASGDFILILNSDDWYEAETVETLVQAQRDSGADFVSSLANYVDGSGAFLRVQPASPFDAGLAFRMPLRHETMLIPARIYNAMGPMDLSYRINADRAYTGGLFDRGYTHHLVEKPLLNFSVDGVSSVNLEGLFAEREQMLSDRFPGLGLSALRDLVNLEKIQPARLLQISRYYRTPEFRAAAVAYALDREAQGHKAWQDIDVDAFSPAIGPRPVIKRGATAQRQARERTPRPAVSVIVPVYKGEKTLAICLDSLLAQTMTDFEVICINDKSPDGSQAIIDAYVAKDQRIRSRQNEVNIGHGASRNRGIEVSRGKYIYHIDPDDAAPPRALEALLAAAEKHGSDIVRGAFMHSQLMSGNASKPTRKGLAEGSPPEINLTLASNPDLLSSTEGHWSCLYASDFAKRVFYPEDLKMGQDSIFITQAYTAARSITRISDLVYDYRANPDSAMNVFNFQKYIDEIEWRHRSFRVLRKFGMADLGAHLLCSYWYLPALQRFDEQFDEGQKRIFFGKLALAFVEAGNGDMSKVKNPKLAEFFIEKIRRFASPAPVQPQNESGVAQSGGLRIAVFSTQDHGGAGIAALRCVEGLRASGHDARLYCILKRTNLPYVMKLPLLQPFHSRALEEHQVYQAWRRHCVLTKDESPQLAAREMLSKPGNMVDPEGLRAIASQADVVHLHWVPGIVDFDRMSEIFGDTPVFWTLHDMNPITGACHYSEGCEEYKNACKECPLAPGAHDLIHGAWKKKLAGLKKVKNLEVICPSDWLADCVRESSLMGDRTVHMVPNLFPSGDFEPTNKMVARRLLGLPLDKKLIVFGADSLANRRKGGDILRDSLTHMRRMHDMTGVEGVFFGSSGLDLDIPVHSMGYVKDPSRLSLIYAAADVFAFPSREDNAPQTVIEALLSGTPVVAFPVGNVPETVNHEDTGYIAAYGDAEEFAKGLIWALQDCTSHEALMRGLRGCIAAREHNDPQTAVSRHIALYRELLDSTYRELLDSTR